jgi:lipid-A-disaccharide synthase
VTIEIFLSAGEASGDLHGSYLVRAIQSLDSQIRVSCLGGSLLRQAGAEVLVDNSEVAVVGLFEVFRHLKTIYEARQRIRTHLIRRRPRLVIFIDFPDFNLLLARLAKRLGIRILYYISPQVWGWRSGRVYTLKRLVDEMAVILPFEKDFYALYGMKVHFVGHPLLDVLTGLPSREISRNRYRSGGARQRRAPTNVVGLLPGSRHGEIRSLLPLLLETAAILLKHHPELSFLLPVAPTLDPKAIESEVVNRRLPIRVISGDTYGVIQACDLILTASGTVTLEAAILGTPMVIVYKVSNLSYYTGRHLIRVSQVGLPNLVAGRLIVPELLQKEARSDRVASEALSFLEQPERLEHQRQALALIRDQLGEPGVADRVARLALRLMKC